MIIILEHKNHGTVAVGELFESVKTRFSEINEFLLALDVLYILDCIEINDLGAIKYVERNQM